MPSQFPHCERTFVYVYGMFSHVLGTWFDALTWLPCHMLSQSFSVCPVESPAIREALYLRMAYLLISCVVVVYSLALCRHTEVSGFDDLPWLS